MKILLDIQDNKAAFILELLKNFAFVKTTKLSEGEIPSLTKAQKKAIDEGILDLEEGRTIPHEQVVEETRRRYPDLFK